MSANVNKVILIGNLTRNPELRYTTKGSAVCNLGLAMNRSWNNAQGERLSETTFVEVTLWARQAEIAHEYLTKGSSVYIEGRLQLDSWEDSTGKKCGRLIVIGEAMQMIANHGTMIKPAVHPSQSPHSQHRSAPVTPPRQHSTPVTTLPHLKQEQDEQDNIQF